MNSTGGVLEITENVSSGLESVVSDDSRSRDAVRDIPYGFRFFEEMTLRYLAIQSREMEEHEWYLGQKGIDKRQADMDFVEKFGGLKGAFRRRFEPHRIEFDSYCATHCYSGGGHCEGPGRCQMDKDQIHRILCDGPYEQKRVS